MVHEKPLDGSPTEGQVSNSWPLRASLRNLKTKKSLRVQRVNLSRIKIGLRQKNGKFYLKKARYMKSNMTAVQVRDINWKQIFQAVQALFYRRFIHPLRRSLSGIRFWVSFEKKILLPCHDVGNPVYHYRHIDMFDILPSSRCWWKSRT